MKGGEIREQVEEREGMNYKRKRDRRRAKERGRGKVSIKGMR